MIQQKRPAPPPEIFEDILGRFLPAHDVVDWISQHIIKPEGQLNNPDHQHLSDARLGVLWTSCENKRHGKVVLGQAEIPMFRNGAWQNGRQEMQMRDWFGMVPDFVITLDAYYCASASDAEFCALLEHELYHCGQKVDEFGMPKFNKETGKPSFAIKGHDVEEFVGVVKRYGMGNPDGPLADMVLAIAKGPQVAKVNISRACGTCMLKAA
jgi:hypothetical protein